MNNYRISILGAVVALIAIMGAVVVGAEFSGVNSNTTPILVSLLAIVSATVPSILALAKVESVSNDIRNGVIVDKSQEGAAKAIADAQLVTRDGPAVMAQIVALQAIVKSNNAILKHITERDDNGRPSV